MTDLEMHDAEGRVSLEWFKSIGGFSIGGGHYLAWNEDGNLWWLMPNCRGMGTVDVTSGERHKIASRDPLTIEGSLLCYECKAHGFVREGRWVPA